MSNDKRTKMDETIRACPDFLYTASPDGTSKSRYWVFQRRTCLTRMEAYAYALEIKLGINDD